MAWQAREQEKDTLVEAKASQQGWCRQELTPKTCRNPQQKTGVNRPFKSHHFMIQRYKVALICPFFSVVYIYDELMTSWCFLLRQLWLVPSEGSLARAHHDATRSKRICGWTEIYRGLRCTRATTVWSRIQTDCSSHEGTLRLWNGGFETGLSNVQGSGAVTNETASTNLHPFLTSPVTSLRGSKVGLWMQFFITVAPQVP